MAFIESILCFIEIFCEKTLLNPEIQIVINIMETALFISPALTVNNEPVIILYEYYQDSESILIPDIITGILLLLLCFFRNFNRVINIFMYVTWNETP